MSDISATEFVLLWLGILVVLALIGAACITGRRRRIAIAIVIVVPLAGAVVVLLIGIWALVHSG